MSDNTTLRPTRQDPIVFEQQQDGLHVVMAVTSGKVLLTNNLGRRILDLCDGSRTETQILDEIAADYPQVNREQIQADLTKCLNTGVQKGVLAWQ